MRNKGRLLQCFVVDKNNQIHITKYRRTLDHKTKGCCLQIQFFVGSSSSGSNFSIIECFIFPGIA